MVDDNRAIFGWEFNYAIFISLESSKLCLVIDTSNVLTPQLSISLLRGNTHANVIGMIRKAHFQMPLQKKLTTLSYVIPILDIGIVQSRIYFGLYR